MQEVLVNRSAGLIGTQHTIDSLHPVEMAEEVDIEIRNSKFIRARRRLYRAPVLPRRAVECGIAERRALASPHE